MGKVDSTRKKNEFNRKECPNAKLATNYRKVPAKYKTDYTFKKIVFHSKEK